MLLTKKPLAETNSVVLCLVEPRTADVLWLHYRAVGSRDLRDAASVDRLIRAAYEEFRTISTR
jgi:hypothetical protein